MATISIELSSNARDVLAQLEALPDRMKQGVARAMDRENQLTVFYSAERYIQGPRPEKLQAVTNRLGGSLTAAKSRVAGNEVISSIGTNVFYGRIHEDGATVTVRAHKRRIIAYDRYQRRGRGFQKTQSGIKGRIKAHQRITPARPFLGPAIADREPYYGQSISEAIVMAWKGGRP